MNEQRKEGIVSSIISGKGGVGKSFITVNLASELGRKGKKVAVIDADMGLSNVATMINQDTPFSVVDWIKGRADLTDVYQKSPYFTLVTVSHDLMHNNVDQYLLLNALDQIVDELRSSHDYILIDSPAGAGSMVFWALDSADYAHLILIDEPSAISDIYKLSKYVLQVSPQYPFCAIVNMAESADHAKRVYERFNEIMNTFQDYSLPYLGGIERDKVVSNAIQQQLPLFKSHQNTTSKLALIKLAEQTILLDTTRAIRINKNIV